MIKSWRETLRHPTSEFLVHGQRFTREMSQRHPGSLLALILREGASLDMAGRDLFSKRFDQKIVRAELNSALFDELDPFGVPDMIGVFSAPEIPPLGNPSLTESELWLATQNPANLGACLRSAAAFGIHKIVLLGEAASPFHSRSVRAAAGQVLEFQYSKGPGIDQLNGLGSAHSEGLIAMDLRGTPIGEFAWPKTFRLLIGEEGQGIPSSTPGQRLHIPMSSSVDSLNAAVSCGIALYAARSKRT